MAFNQDIAHLTHPDGTNIQVLIQDGSNWDEAATFAAYAAYVATKA